MLTNEQVDARLARWIEGWRAAQARCHAITDEKARAHALRVADELFTDGVRDCLRPLFKPARKHKDKKPKRNEPPR
jgi:hypothetical protein